MGIFLAFCAALFGSTKDLISKRLAFDVSGTLSTLASFLFALPFYLIALLFCHFSGSEVAVLSIAFVMYVLLRGLTDTFGEWCKMEAYSCGEISLVAPFIALSPLFLLFTSPLITGDPLSGKVIAGVLLISSGSFIALWAPGRKNSKQERRAVLLGLASAFFFSLNDCLNRLALKSAGPVFTGFSMTLVSAVMVFPVACRSGNPWSALKLNARGFMVRGFFEALYMTTKLAALQFLSAPYVSSIQRGAVILSIIGGRIFFNEHDTSRRLLAGGLVVCGVAVMLL